MGAVLTKKWFTGGRCPLNGCQQQSVAVTKCKQLLVSARPKTLFANNFSAFAFRESRGYDFRGTSSSGVNQNYCRAIKQHYFGIRIKCVKRLSFLSDRLSQRAVFYKEVCRCYTF